MASKVFGVKESQKAVTLKITKIIQDKKFLKKLGNDIVKKLKGKARSGKSIVDGTAFPKLSPGYIIFRRVYAALRQSQMHPLFKAQRSNLTFFGKLLDAIDSRVSKPGRKSMAEIVIEIKKGTGQKPDKLDTKDIAKTLAELRVSKDMRKFAYIWNALIARQSAKSLKQISDDVQRHRPFMGLDEQTIKTIKTQVRSQLRRELKT